jgi:hypothetical protein
VREDFADMNQMTRKGSGWHNFRDDRDLSTMEFRLAEGVVLGGIGLARTAKCSSLLMV